MKYADDTEGRIRRIKDQDATIAALVAALEWALASLDYCNEEERVNAEATLEAAKEGTR